MAQPECWVDGGCDSSNFTENLQKTNTTPQNKISDPKLGTTLGMQYLCRLWGCVVCCTAVPHKLDTTLGNEDFALSPQMLQSEGYPVKEEREFKRFSEPGRKREGGGLGVALNRHGTDLIIASGERSV
jgi:hypothetical protein